MSDLPARGMCKSCSILMLWNLPAPDRYRTPAATRAPMAVCVKLVCGDGMFGVYVRC